MENLQTLSLADIRGWIYKFLADGFKYPSSERRIGLSDNLGELFLRLDKMNDIALPSRRTPQLVEGKGADSETLASLLDKLKELEENSLDEHRYITLFDVNPIASLYEGSYSDPPSEAAQTFSFDNPGSKSRNRLLWEMSQYYKRAGLEMKKGAELPDHLTVKLEFMEYLTYLVGRFAKSPYNLEECHKTEREFLDKYLLGWIGKLIFALERAGEKKSIDTDFYITLAKISSLFFLWEKEHNK